MRPPRRDGRAVEQVIVLGTVTGSICHCAGDRSMPVHFPPTAVDRIQVKDHFEYRFRTACQKAGVRYEVFR